MPRPVDASSARFATFLHLLETVQVRAFPGSPLGTIIMTTGEIGARTYQSFGLTAPDAFEKLCVRWRFEGRKQT